MKTEKKIEDYLHLLIGCNVKLTGGAIFKLVGIKPMQAKPIERGIQTFAVLQHEDSIIDILAYHCAPILRPLSSMTEEDQRNLSRIDRAFAERYSNDQERAFLIEAQKIQYLLSKHFDLFGLIEAGLAIDATTQTQQTTNPSNSKDS